MALSSMTVHTALNLFLVYISWGSLYAGFKITLEFLPPFLACGIRMVLAGLVLFAVLPLLGRWKKPARTDIVYAAKLGIFMVLMASGFLGKGQDYVATGVAAVVLGSTPIFMLLGAWLFGGEPRPTALQWVGLAGGFCGLVLLGLSQTGPEQSTSFAGLVWLFLATLGWVAGSLLTRRFPCATALSGLQSCALLLFMGGLETTLLGLLCGEVDLIRWQNLRPAVLLALGWMVVGGSIIAYASYFWLLHNVRIAVAVSYEYVVPAIGMFIGWAFMGETVTLQMVLACALTVCSVFFVLQQRHNG